MPRLQDPTSKTVDLATSADAVVLEGRQECDAWRTFILSANAPCNAVLEWGSALGTAESATVSVSRASKVCVFASWWKLSVANGNGGDTRVRAGRLDHFVDVDPVYEEHFDSAAAGRDHTIPTWAHDVRLDTTTDNDAQTGSVIKLKDSGGTVRAAVTGVRQPLWIPLGLAASLSVVCEAPYRLVWRLRLL